MTTDCSDIKLFSVGKISFSEPLEMKLILGVLCVATGVIPILFMLKTQYYDPVYIAPKKIESDKILKQKDEEAREVLFYNRYGAPSRPLRSLDDMIAFLGGSDTYAELADFNSYQVSQDINQDQQNGLDSWMSEDDAKMMKYYQESLKHGGH